MLNIEYLTVTTRGENSKDIVQDLCLRIEAQTIVGLVGGSGSGKSTTGLAIIRLLSSGLKVKTGKIYFQGRNMLEIPEDRMQAIRGKEIGMVFQEPLEAFNPVLRIGCQIEEVMVHHTDLNRSQRREKLQHLLQKVGIPDPDRIIQSYPHQLSGGLRQRAMIAQALAADPKLIIADEPTSNLDVTLQAQIIELFWKLRSEFKVSMLLISHDLGMVQHLADSIAVMNNGRIIEHAATDAIISQPQQDYTHQLMRATKF